MFSKIYDTLSSGLKPCKPFPNASDREAIESLSTGLKSDVIKRAEKYLNYEFKGIPITVFMNFSRTGNRVAFEDLNFEKRYAINALILGEFIEHKGRFLDNIINGIFSICEESAWQLPPHNSYERGGKNLILPDTSDPVIDLFAAETGALLATASYLLYDEFESVSPLINKRIYSELRTRIYTPFITRHFWWMGNGDEPMCNWTVWCIQNVLLSVFLMNEAYMGPSFSLLDMNSDAFKQEVLKKACYGIDCFLKDYGDDGCCEEGAHYYGHSGLCLFNCMEILNEVTDNAFLPLYSDKKLRNLATFIFNMHVDDKYYINYADCSPVIDRQGARTFLFGKRIGNLEMMRFAANDFKKGNNHLLDHEINLFYRLQNLFTYDEMKAFNTNTPVVHSDIYYESVGVFVARDSHYTLSVKAGDNNDSHNHNDTGSLIIYKDGKPLLIDVGVESYTAKTFSSERYTIWTMQSAYHNLPTINGVMQKDGENFKATDVKTFLSDGLSDISMDIAKAYPKEAGVSSYKRHATLYKEKQIVIEDEISFTKGDISTNELFLILMVYDKPSISGNDIHLANSKISIIGNVFISAEAIPITDARLKTSWEHEIYRIMIVPKTEKIMIVVQ